MTVAASRLTWAALGVAVVAWLYLFFGLVYANFFVTQSPPNPVIVFSAKGLTSLLFELGSLCIGCLGLLLALIAFVWSPHSRLLALAAIANSAVCATCVAMLL
jgi:hypothetical protein